MKLQINKDENAAILKGSPLKTLKPVNKSQFSFNRKPIKKLTGLTNALKNRDFVHIFNLIKFL